MAHYAKVDKNVVVNVIVADASFFDDFVDTAPGEWIQTSYNTRAGVHYQDNEDGTRTPSPDQSKALRKNYANIGMIYDRERDAFYEKQPYPSWVLNEDSCLWEAPVSYPEDGNKYIWNETELQWKAI